MHPTLAFLSDVGGGEMIVCGIVALLLFGKNLPTQARSIGKAIGQFKKHLNDAKSEITKEMDNAARDFENAAKDAKVHEAVADIDRTIRDEPAPKKDSIAQAPKVADKPTALDAPAAITSNVSTSTVEKTRLEASVTSAASLDNLERNIPAPTKIPPPI